MRMNRGEFLKIASGALIVVAAPITLGLKAKRYTFNVVKVYWKFGEDEGRASIFLDAIKDEFRFQITMNGGKTHNYYMLDGNIEIENDIRWKSRKVIIHGKALQLPDGKHISDEILAEAKRVINKTGSAVS